MGSFSILNNIAGLNAHGQLNINNVNLNRTLLRLSSGRRINSGADAPSSAVRHDPTRSSRRGPSRRACCQTAKSPYWSAGSWSGDG